MSVELPSYRRADFDVNDRVADLLSRMTLEEKIDQLHQGNVGDTNPNNLAARADDFRPTYGSYIIGGPSVFEIRNALQRRALNESRLGIPVIFGADVIHGWRVITPIPLAQACTWNPSLVEQGAAMTAAEARAQGVDWTFAPMVDHCVDARWGRIAETFGESPYASGVFAAASVSGFQGATPGAPGSLAACLKHYVGYGESEGGRDYSATDISMQSLWEHHLPAFKAGLRAGARTVMSAFNDLNGVPTSANRHTLTEILRDQWGFTGLVVSDWNSVLQLTNQGFAVDEAEAVEKALNAGVDLDMADGLYAKHLAALVTAGRVTIERIDEAVRRVLRIKFELGLFERPLAERSPLTDAPPGEHPLELAEELAAQSIVLLKNNGILPLTFDGPKHIALIGPLAENRGALLGSWAQQGRPEETASIAEALRARLPAEVSLHVAAGCPVESENPADFTSARAAARASDVVILCVGEEQWMSGENASRSTLRLAGQQEELARALLTCGKPVVLVLVSGRPLELHFLEPKVQAIIAAWQGGSRAAAALADVLLGRRNPSGRLAVTWPRTTGQIPISHLQRPRARPRQEGAYRDLATPPQYEFGHGLGYSAFEYTSIRLSQTAIHSTDTLVAELTVKNAGAYAGAESVLWFIRDPVASITRPLKELKHFERATIKPDDSHVFRFAIDPMRDLSFPDAAGRRILESGEIVLHAGPRMARFTLMTDPLATTG
ncbi:MAG TPA: glycoside hydrolase family 3 N-terminal domain-containing protein [Opitutus sp.]|nr:glycoside hydrolase family 3 N-terminal domain-containing protein [Opitutus sp.]